MTTPKNLPAPSAPRELAYAAREDLEAFQELMFQVLSAWGLPTDKILVEVRHRETLLRNTPGVILEELTDEQRAESPYLAKMIMAGSVGLFDAALNYLWNETINRLRDHVAAFDVSYFFDLAEADPERRKNLKTKEDLAQIGDYDLLEAANKIQLISDVGHKQLVLINYMRNHASAAHPNIEELTGLKLAEWLETCIKEVFQIAPKNVVAQIGKLLRNVKAKRLPQEELRLAASSFGDLPQDQADNLANGLFGIYTPADAEPHVLDNIRQLWPELWPEVSEGARNGLGIKLARFRANLDGDPATRARELLDLVDGSAYLPEPERALEIQQALDDLMRAHEGTNNFYNEPPAADRLKDVVGRHGDIPSQLSFNYVSTLVDAFLTNSHGVAWNAEPTYTELISRFDSYQAGIALRSFVIRKIRNKLDTRVPHPLSHQKWEELIKLLIPKLTGRQDRAFLTSIRDFKGTPAQLAVDPQIKKQAQQWLDSAKGKTT
ncbi:hypothetical protein ACFHW2_25980 [Actinomadura sp. LOL_016]|uniref:hypothetical protein n=1 Tax=unclassified Actinomadura TaxID=2626254 RepID=UPI003A7F8A6D